MSIAIVAKEQAILDQVRIPPRPEVLLAISKEAKKPEPSVTAIAEIVVSDVSLSAAVLQVVNSPAFARRVKIKSIHQAVMILGFRRVFPLIKAVAIRSSLSLKSRNLTLEELWDKGAAIANAAAHIANELNRPALTDNAYMLGLFHIAGIAVMLQHFDEYEQVLAQGDRSGWDNMIQQERELFHTSHNTIGALLAESWQLPTEISELIYNYQDVDEIFESGELSDTSLQLLAILKLARRVVSIRNDSFSMSTEWDRVDEQIMNYLDVDDVAIENLIEGVIFKLDESN